MEKEFSMMTKKMQDLYMDIVASLGQLPIEQKGYIFGFEGEVDYTWIKMVTEHIVLEYIKYSYDYSDPVYPLRHFLQNTDDDSERMTQQRIMQYVLKYKKQEIEMKGVTLSSDHKYANIDMDGIEKKLNGYHITEMNYFEHQNIHDLDIIKSIVEDRIVSSKKVSNSRFAEIFEQYDSFVESLIDRSKLSDEDMVFASLDYFTFEWHYPIELFYYLSCIMEEEEMDSIDVDSLLLLCSYVSVESRFGGWFSTDSRMIKYRMFVTEPLFVKGLKEADRETLTDLIKEVLALVVRYKEVEKVKTGGLYKDWFREESGMEDWTSFFRYYDVFAIWQKKQWTPKRIQKMRYLCNVCFNK